MGRKRIHTLQAVLAVGLFLFLFAALDPLMRDTYSASLSVGNEAQRGPEITEIAQGQPSVPPKTHLCRYHGSEWETTVLFSPAAPASAVATYEHERSLEPIGEPGLLGMLGDTGDPLISLAYGLERVAPTGTATMPRLLGYENGIRTAAWGIVFAYPGDKGGSVLLAMHLKNEMSLANLVIPADSEALRRELSTSVSISPHATPVDKIEHESGGCRVSTYLLDNSCSLEKIARYYIETGQAVGAEEPADGEVVQRIALYNGSILLHHSRGKPVDSSQSVIKVRLSLQEGTSDRGQ